MQSVDPSDRPSSRPNEPIKTSNLERAAFGAGLALVAHGGYLAYYYLRHRSLNTISAALVLFTAALFAFLVVLIAAAKLITRSEARRVGTETRRIESQDPP